MLYLHSIHVFQLHSSDALHVLVAAEHSMAASLGMVKFHARQHNPPPSHAHIIYIRLC
jgi:hypothetical protein